MRYLFVGDPHAKIGNLEEMQKLVDFLCQLTVRERFDFIFLAGDLFNDHAVVRLEVALFWRNALARLCAAYKEVVAIDGNHDKGGTKQLESAISAIQLISGGYDLKNFVHITKPTNYHDIAIIPYMSNEDEFVAAANELFEGGAVDLLMCHQTFNGAKYDNGFYAPGGFDIERIKQGRIHSGHIHTEQEFDKVWYPGTARWETRSDANLNKGVWDVQLEADSFQKTLIPTNTVVTPIIELVIKEGDPVPPMRTDAKIYVELVGTSEWIKKAKETYRGVASIKTTHKDAKVKLGTMGRGLSMEEYLDKWFDTTLVSKDQLREAIKAL
jgi:DNA repair exonuclease SbcCD nuclease subunit